VWVKNGKFGRKKTELVNGGVVATGGVLEGSFEAGGTMAKSYKAAWSDLFRTLGGGKKKKKKKLEASGSKLIFFCGEFKRKVQPRARECRPTVRKDNAYPPTKTRGRHTIGGGSPCPLHRTMH